MDLMQVFFISANKYFVLLNIINLLVKAFQTQKKQREEKSINSKKDISK